MPSLLISGGPLLSLLCLAWLRHCHRLVVEVVDWCASRLVKPIRSVIILIAEQSRESVDLPLTWYMSPRLATFVFSEVTRLLFDLDPYGGSDPLGLFLFLRELMIWRPRLSVGFRRFLRLGSSQLGCWRQANVTPIPNAPPSSSVTNYRPILISSVLSKVLSVWCPFASDDLWNAVVCFQPPDFLSERSGYLWCTFLRVPYTAKCIGEYPGGYDRTDWFCRSFWTVREFSITSFLWLLEVLCCRCWRSFYQIDHSTL